jgi:hypothetical protein
MSKLRALAVAVGAIVVMAASANAASASGIQVSPGGAITGTSAQTLTLSGGSISLACNLTFTGSLRTDLVPGSAPVSAGAITGASGGGCTNTGSVSFPANPNWNIEFTGLNATTGAPQLQIQGISTHVTILGFIACDYTGNANAELTAARTITFNSSLSTSSGGLCPNPGALRGTVTLDNGQTVTLLP